VDRLIAKQKKNLSVEERAERVEEWFSRRLDAGLFCLQMIDVILAWLCAEDDGAKGRIVSLLEKDGESLNSVKQTLNGRLHGINSFIHADSLSRTSGSDG